LKPVEVAPPADLHELLLGLQPIPQLGLRIQFAVEGHTGSLEFLDHVPCELLEQHATLRSVHGEEVLHGFAKLVKSKVVIVGPNTMFHEIKSNNHN
jgi:hypothetical protein